MDQTRTVEAQTPSLQGSVGGVCPGPGEGHVEVDPRPLAVCSLQVPPPAGLGGQRWVLVSVQLAPGPGPPGFGAVSTLGLCGPPRTGEPATHRGKSNLIHAQI